MTATESRRPSFAARSVRHRATILGALADGGWHTYRSLRESTGLSQSVLSNHLNQLCWGLVEDALRPNPHPGVPGGKPRTTLRHFRLKENPT